MDSKELKNVAERAIALAREEINTYGVPDMLLLDISLDNGRKIAKALDANQHLVEIGISMMDVKLGQAFKEKRIKDHVGMSIETAKDFLKEFNLSENDLAIIINAIQGHHGGKEFNSIEAEICANADCYRFIHPKGVFLYFTVLGKRLGDFNACLDQVEAKMDEKFNIISLPIVKNELEPIYKTFKEYISSSRK